MAVTKSKKLKIIPLGGLNEIGKNCNVLEYQDEIIIVDCGLGFPDEDMLGVDIVIPDFTYLVDNLEKIKAIFITHGHEDHIGSVPYLLQQMNIPIYATAFTIGIIKNKLQEHNLPYEPEFHVVNSGDVIEKGVFSVEFIHVNHSIADSCALAINTPVGLIVHSGDFKIDTTPLIGEMTDLARFGELGKQGVKLLMCESTNVERPGYTPSETTVAKSLDRLFDQYRKNRIIIATFSSNTSRIQHIINLSRQYKRKIVISGRSMTNVVQAAIELGYLDLPDNQIVDIEEADNYPPEQVTIISTGSQGEPMSALYRMAFGLHTNISLTPSDVVIISASAIPGNEKLVGNIENQLITQNITIVTDSTESIHVSGHACQEEIKLLHALCKPQYVIPVHGETRHLYKHKELAESLGTKPNNVFIMENGSVLEIDGKTAKLNGEVTAGARMIDGSLSDVRSIVLADRKRLSQEGLVVISVTLNMLFGELIGGPEIVTRGFIYEKDSTEFINELKRFSGNIIKDALYKRAHDYATIRQQIKEELSKYIYIKTKAHPMILILITNVNT